MQLLRFLTSREKAIVFRSLSGSVASRRSQQPSRPKPGTNPAPSTPLSSVKSYEYMLRTQGQLLAATRNELQGGTFQSHSLLDVLSAPNREAVDFVLNKLQTVYAINNTNLKYADSERSGPAGSLKPWPQPNASEKKHYRPLTWLINTVLHMSRKGGIKNKFHSNLRFAVYDREMKEGEGVDDPIKPDILGIHRTSPLPNGKKVSWHDVHILVEVKKSWPNLISQMSTYAWSCLSIQRNRKFVPVIHYNHKNSEIRIGLYTRSGLVATEALRISTVQGFRQFVGIIVGIFSWTPAASGIDNSRTKKYFYLPDKKIYSVGDTLCDRRCVRGRATRVHCLELARDMPQTLICSAQLWAVDNQSEEDNPVDKLAAEAISTVVIKESWVLASHDNEAAVFQNQGHEFGLPNFLFSYAVTNARMGTGCTDELIPEDATYWNVFKDKASDGVKPEVRIHKRIVFGTLGTPLQNARGPRQLVEAIIHAMLGHFNLFKRGWLHRDVSVGNVMMMKKEVRRPVSEFACSKDITDCVGFISDGDQAVRWGEEPGKGAERRSGTLPFISVRLISVWDSSESQILHTPIDDLESFVWVLLWSVLTILESHHKLNWQDQKWLETMRTDTVVQQTNRSSIVLALKQQHAAERFSKGLAPFGPLLVTWLSDAEDANFKLGMLETRKRNLTEFDYEEVYEKFIESGLQHMTQLADTWVDN